MTELVIENYTPYAARNATAPAEGSSPYMSAGDICNAEVRDNIPHYAVLDTVAGINLRDDSLVFAVDGDNLGYISAAASDAEGITEQTITVELANGYYDVEKLTVRWHKQPCIYYRIKLTADGSTVAETTVAESNTDVNQLVHVIDLPAQGINGLTITVRKTWQSYQLVKLIGIDFGADIHLTEFIDAPEIYHEISIDFSDAPASTMDFTALIPDGAVPKAGQVIYAYADGQVFGKFRIEEIDRQGRDIYAVQCGDDLTMLEQVPLPDAFVIGRYDNDVIRPKDDIALISEAAGIVIDPPEQNSQLAGIPVLDDNCRQHLARMCSQPYDSSRYGYGNYVSTSMSRHLHFFGTRNTGKTVTADRILGEASYKPKLAPKRARGIRYIGDDKNGATALYGFANPHAVGGVEDIVEYTEFTLTRYSASWVKGRSTGHIKDYIFPRRAFLSNEITASIIWDGERVGDEITIETPYNGLVPCIIRSIQLQMTDEIIATITALEFHA